LATYDDFSVENPILEHFRVTDDRPSQVVTVAVETQVFARNVGAIRLAWQKEREKV